MGQLAGIDRPRNPAPRAPPACRGIDSTRCFDWTGPGQPGRIATPGRSKAVRFATAHEARRRGRGPALCPPFSPRSYRPGSGAVRTSALGPKERREPGTMPRPVPRTERAQESAQMRAHPCEPGGASGDSVRHRVRAARPRRPLARWRRLCLGLADTATDERFVNQVTRPRRNRGAARDTTGARARLLKFT